MNRRTFLQYCGVAAGISLLGVSALANTAASVKPNVLFILIDDLGWNDVGYHGSTFYETPHMDELSRVWMRFDSCYTPSPMCSPTRVSIMTGKNPARHGVTQWLPGSAKWPGHSQREQVVLCPRPKASEMARSEVTLGETLQQAGYETAFYGKWHMGRFKSTGGPRAHGFAEQKAVIEENNCRMFYPFCGGRQAKYFPDAKPGDNFTDLLTDASIEFVSRKRQRPFFLYLAHFAMHAPIASKPGLKQKFADKAAGLPALSVEERRVHDAYAHQPYNKRQDSPDYAGELATLDENVGRLIQALKDTGPYENTIVILTGDNGGRTAFFHSPPTAVQPLRAGKTFTFEGGIRTPLLIHWPGVTQAGKQCATPVSSMDFYPTILDMIGLPQMPPQHVDGVSLVPLIRQGQLKDRPLYWHFPHYQGEGGYPSSAIRQGKYKLVLNYHHEDVLLYDVVNDPGETDDLAAAMPEQVRALKQDLSAYLERTGAVIPQKNPAFKTKEKEHIDALQQATDRRAHTDDSDWFALSAPGIGPSIQDNRHHGQGRLSLY